MAARAAAGVDSRTRPRRSATAQRYLLVGVRLLTRQPVKSTTVWHPRFALKEVGQESGGVAQRADDPRRDPDHEHEDGCTWPRHPNDGHDRNDEREQRKLGRGGHRWVRQQCGSEGVALNSDPARWSFQITG